MLRADRIFISVPAFNEPDLVKTIHNAMAQAKDAGRLNFGILYHDTENDFFDLSQFENVKFVRTDHDKMLGVGLSRLLTNSLYNNEEYYFQIDAHTIFDTWWDEKLINYYNEIKKSENIDKIIISQYVPQWHRKNENIILDKIYYDYTALPVYSDTDEYSDIPLMSTEGVDWSTNKSYYEHYGLSAHFLFTSGKFCQEILPDPQILFYGEEPTLAVRAWTRGYRMFAIRHAGIWHKRKVTADGEDTEDNIIDNLKENDRVHFTSKDEYLNEIFMAHLHNGLQKTRDILTGEILGYWGAASIQSLKEYEEKAGIDFKLFYKEMDEKQYV